MASTGRGSSRGSGTSRRKVAEKSAPRMEEEEDDECMPLVLPPPPPPPKRKKRWNPALSAVAADACAMCGTSKKDLGDQPLAK